MGKPNFVKIGLGIFVWVLFSLIKLMFSVLQQSVAFTKRWGEWTGQFMAICGRFLLIFVLVVSVIVGGAAWSGAIAWASLQDDRFDGNIFALYAGNGSLVPPVVSLAQSLKADRPTILTFYIEDSKDCKQFSARISELQAYYGRAVDILPINVDSIPVQTSYAPDEPGYYYTGQVPQTIIFDIAGEKVLDITGKASFEQFDDVLRSIFNLLPREESTVLKRRPLNEVNAELTQ